MKRTFLTILMIFIYHSSIEAKAQELSGISEYSGRTIHIMVPRFGSASPFEDLIEISSEFWERHNIRIDYSVVQYDAMQDRQIEELTTGSNSWDVIVIDSQNLHLYAGTGNMRPMSAFLGSDGDIDLSDFFPAALNISGIYDDELYALPIIGSSGLLLYNKCLLQQNNIDFPPQTWQEMASSLTTAFSSPISLDANQHGIAFPWNSGNAPLANLTRMSGAELFEGERRAGSIRDNASAGFAIAQELEPLMPPDWQSHNSHDVVNMVVGGQVAVGAAWSNLLQTWRVESLEFDQHCLGVAPEPRGVSGLRPPLHAYSLGIPDASEDPDLAWLYIKWATSAEVADRLFRAGSTPLRASIYQRTDATFEIESQFAKAFAETWGGVDLGDASRPLIGSELTAYISADVLSTLMGNMTVSDWLDQIEFHVPEASSDNDLWASVNRPSDMLRTRTTSLQASLLSPGIKRILEARYRIDDLTDLDKIPNGQLPALEREALDRLTAEWLSTWPSSVLSRLPGSPTSDWLLDLARNEQNSDKLSTDLPFRLSDWQEAWLIIPPDWDDDINKETAPDIDGGSGSPEITTPDENVDSGAPDVGGNAASASTAIRAGGNLPIRRYIYPQPIRDGQNCRAPEPSVGVLSIQEFFAPQENPVRRRSVISCREGFLDSALIADINNDVCSGVWLHRQWLLTVRHCAEGFLANDPRGAIYLVNGKDLHCLDQKSRWSYLEANPGEMEMHPGERCGLRTATVNRAHYINTWAEENDESLWGREFVLIEVDHGPERSHYPFIFRGPTIDGEDLIELAVAGFGHTSGGEHERSAGGSLNIGRSVIESLDPTPTGHLNISLVDSGAPLLISHACAGDSGSPVYVGRPHGYRNEAHALVGLITSSDRQLESEKGEECSDIARSVNAASPRLGIRTTRIRALTLEGIDRWICETTSDAITWCGTPNTRANERAG